jgi:hypothetical protein
VAIVKRDFMVCVVSSGFSSARQNG